MNAVVRLAAFAVVLAAIFGASFGVGAAFGPSTADEQPKPDPQHTTGHDE